MSHLKICLLLVFFVLGGETVGGVWVLPSEGEICKGIKVGRDKQKHFWMHYTIHKPGLGGAHDMMMEAIYAERAEGDLVYFNVHETEIDSVTGEDLKLVRSLIFSYDGVVGRDMRRDINRRFLKGENLNDISAGIELGVYDGVEPRTKMWHIDGVVAEDYLFKKRDGVRVSIEDGGVILGVRTVKVVRESEDERGSYWFAPSRDYLRLRQEVLTGVKLNYLRRFVVSELKQLESGIWHPMRVKIDGGEIGDFEVPYFADVNMLGVSSRVMVAEDFAFDADGQIELERKRDKLMGEAKVVAGYGGIAVVLLGGGVFVLRKRGRG